MTSSRVDFRSPAPRGEQRSRRGRRRRRRGAPAGRRQLIGTQSRAIDWSEQYTGSAGWVGGRRASVLSTFVAQNERQRQCRQTRRAVASSPVDPRPKRRRQPPPLPLAGARADGRAPPASALRPARRRRPAAVCGGRYVPRRRWDCWVVYRERPLHFELCAGPKKL